METDSGAKWGTVLSDTSILAQSHATLKLT
jgi:hypothetical protein